VVIPAVRLSKRLPSLCVQVSRSPGTGTYGCNAPAHDPFGLPGGKGVVGSTPAVPTLVGSPLQCAQRTSDISVALANPSPVAGSPSLPTSRSSGGTGDPELVRCAGERQVPMRAQGRPADLAAGAGYLEHRATWAWLTAAAYGATSLCPRHHHSGHPPRCTYRSLYRAPALIQVDNAKRRRSGCEG